MMQGMTGIQKAIMAKKFMEAQMEAKMIKMALKGKKK